MWERQKENEDTIFPDNYLFIVTEDSHEVRSQKEMMEKGKEEPTWPV